MTAILSVVIDPNMKHHSLKATGDLLIYMVAFGILALYWKVYSDTRRKANKRRK